MFKRVGKPVFFIVALIIAGITCLAVLGFHTSFGDTTTWYVKGAQQMRFGIDIRGGVDVTFKPQNNYKATKNELTAATAKINQRLDAQRITDREVYTDYNKNRIIVRFPWKSDEKNFDPEKAIKELGSTANLNFKDPKGTIILEGKDVDKAEAAPDTEHSGYYCVELTFKSSGTKKFADATTRLAPNHEAISINMDNTQLTNPNVQEAITGGKCSIQGNYTAESAKALADKINGGALPFALVSDNYNAISPTLGTNALHVMLMAGLVAFILICLFMIFYYRIPGFIACIGLCGHVAGTILAISVPQFTLTLPGIAGIILSIGMGVDCNIITAERVKEELRAGKTLDAAVDLGFDRSFSAIFDGNITVIIVAIILMTFGSGSVLSFGYTLLVGVVFNFIMGIIASRLMLKSFSKIVRKNVLYGEAAK